MLSGGGSLHFALVLTALSLLGRSIHAQELADPEHYLHLRYTDFEEIDYGADYPGVVWERDFPAGLTSLVKAMKRNRPPNVEYRQSFLVKGSGGREFGYLVIQWRADETMKLEIHRIALASNGRFGARYLRDWKSWPAGWHRIQPVQPSGLPLEPGGDRAIVINFSSGGSGAEGYGASLFLAKNNSIDITPDWAGRLVALRDIDGDAHMEALVIDGRWANYFFGCGACGPHVLTILTWRDGRFVPACRSFKEIYDLRFEAKTAWIEEVGDQGFIDNAWGSLALEAAQAGNWERAWFAYDSLLATLIRWGWDEGALAQVDRDIGAAIRAAQENPLGNCPISATSPRFGGHMGYELRVDYFR